MSERIEWLVPNPAAERLVTRAQAHCKRDEFEKAFALLRKAFLKWPDSPDVNLHLALYMSWIDNDADALRIIESLRLRYPLWPLAMLVHQSIATHADDLLLVQRLGDELAELLPRSHRYCMDAAINLGMLQLKRGMWRDGFANMEWEFTTQRRTVRGHKTVPPWQGQTNPDGVLFLYWDQGFGDTMLMARFLPEAKRIWQGRIVLAVRQPMFRWAQRWKGYDELIVSESADECPECDMKLSVMGLPFACGIETDEQVSRNAVLCDVPPAEDVPQDAVNIGLCWRGSDEFTQNSFRSMPWSAMERLIGIHGVRYWSFQIGKYQSECSAADVVPLHERITDFWDTCRYLKAMDLTISVDTSVVNAAGACGANAWALAWNPVEMRWGPRDVRRGKWYPQIRAYWREPQSEWSPVLEAVRNDLQAFVTSHPRLPTT